MKRQKDQRGFGLIEALIALSLFVILTAMLGQSLQSLIQATNEKNIAAGLLAFQTAEASYIAAYPSSGYATGSNITNLSTCPAAGSKVSATAACLLPPAYTSGSEVYHYTLNVVTPTDAPSCSSAPCGFVVTANPQNPSAGRMEYCVDSDGVLHGEVSHTSLSLSTNAACSALPTLTAGQPSSAPSGGAGAVVLTNSGPAGPINTFPLQTMTVPSGDYQVTAHINFGAGGNNSNSYGCTLLSGGTTLDTYSYAGGSGVTFGATLTGLASSTTAISLSCNGAYSIPSWTLVMTAVPVSSVASQS